MKSGNHFSLLICEDAIKTVNSFRNKISYYEAVSAINDHLCNDTESSGHKNTVHSFPSLNKVIFEINSFESKNSTIPRV